MKILAAAMSPGEWLMVQGCTVVNAVKSNEKQPSAMKGRAIIPLCASPVPPNNCLETALRVVY